MSPYSHTFPPVDPLSKETRREKKKKKKMEAEVLQEQTTEILTPKENRFVHEYLVDFNGIQAFVRAGYKSKSRSAIANRASRAYELLHKPHIARVIEKRKAELLEKIDVETIQMLREAKRLSLSDPAKLFDEKGNLKSIHEIDEDTRRCIASIEVEELFEGRGKNKETVGRLKKVKLWDKNAALDKLFRYLALYKDPGTKDNPVHHQVQVVYEKMHTQN